MVQVIQPRDIGEEIGKSVGGGLSKMLERGVQRKQGLRALDALESIDPNEWNSMPFNQKMSTVARAFMGQPGGERIIAELFPAMLKHTQNLASTPTEGDIDPALVAEMTRLESGIKGGDSVSQELPQGEERTEVTAPPAEPVGIPDNAPQSFRSAVQVFPDIQGQAFRGNPQGLTLTQKAQFAQSLKQRGTSPEAAAREAENLSSYLKEQHGIYQGLQNKVMDEARAEYGDSPNYDTMSRIMLNKANREIDAGRMEPNALIAAARKDAKQVEQVINNAPLQQGRPWFELNISDRMNKSRNWISPLLQRGDNQSAMEFLTSDNLGTNRKGEMLKGPDWGPVRASEIVQKETNPQGLQRQVKFADGLKTIRKFPSTSAQVNQRQQLDIEQNVAALASYMADPEQFLPKDSLVTLRAYAKAKGVNEDKFEEALQKAMNARGGEFSDYQNWERSTYLPLNVRPSPGELWNRVRTISDLITEDY